MTCFQILNQKNHPIRFVFVILFCGCATAFCAIGQSAIITLSFPYGTREAAMGEVGTGIAEDASATFYNPAGLGLDDTKRIDGGVLNFFEPLLPAFDMPDLWHVSFAGYVKPNTKNSNVGGIGVLFNYLNFGRNVETNAQGVTTRVFDSYECVYGISYGTNFDIFRDKKSNWYFGVNVKGAYSALAPGAVNGIGTASTFAIDAATLYDFPFGLRCGFMLQNMGPAVSYVSKNENDPIPFTIRTGVSYQKELVVMKMRVFKGLAAFDLDREVVRKNPYGKSDPFWKAIYTDLIHDTTESTRDEIKQIIFHTGGEATFFNNVTTRFGYMHDAAGSRKELHFGFGVSAFNHVSFDWSNIYSRGDTMSPARDGQWSISLTLYNLGRWKLSDFKWWEVE